MQRQPVRPCRKTLLAVLILALVPLGCSSPNVEDGPTLPPPELTPLPPMSTSAGRALAAAEVLRLVNEERAKVGLPAYEVDPAYMEAAQLRADQIIETERYSHDGPNGEILVVAALEASGVDIKRGFVEALTMAGNEDPLAGAAVAVGSWMESPNHRDIVLYSLPRIAGVGVAWAGPPGMEFGSQPGDNFGVAGVYVLLVGDIQAIDVERMVQEFRASGETIDLSSIERRAH